VKRAWRERLIDRCAALPPGLGRAPGEFPALLADGVEALGPWASRYLPARVLSGAGPLLILFAALARDPLSALVLAVTGPLIPLFMVLIGRLTRETASRQLSTLLALSGRFAGTLRGLFTLKLLGRIPEARASLEAHHAAWAGETMTLLRTVFLSALVLEWLTTISTAVVAVEAGMRLLYGKMPFEAALFVILLAPEFFAPLRQLGLRFHALQDAKASAEKLLEFAPAVPSTPFPGRAQPSPAARPSAMPVPPEESNKPQEGNPHLIRFPIEMRGISFRWEDRSALLFDELELRLGRGECLGITGKSGEGKSTLARLLLRLETGGDLLGGRCLSGGVDWNGIPRPDWHRGCAWFSQQTHLFHGSVRENLLLAAPGASEESLWQALEDAGLAEKVRSLPDGLETPAGEDGLRFSGGERQRLALARALLKGAPLWVLDEFTSQLDRTTEEGLLSRFARLRAGRSVLLISHREAALAVCDRVLVLEGGKLRGAAG